MANFQWWGIILQMLINKCYRNWGGKWRSYASAHGLIVTHLLLGNAYNSDTNTCLFSILLVLIWVVIIFICSHVACMLHDSKH